MGTFEVSQKQKQKSETYLYIPTSSYSTFIIFQMMFTPDMLQFPVST